MRPGRVTRICSWMPACRKRSKPCRRTLALGSVRLLTGQPWPTQRALTLAFFGPRTESSVIRAPVRLKKPRIRTTGNGSRKLALGGADEAATTCTGAGGGGAGGGGGGAGGGGATTTGVAALFSKTGFVAVAVLVRSMRAARREPTSAAVTTYVLSVAPAIAGQMLLS